VTALAFAARNERMQILWPYRTNVRGAGQSQFGNRWGVVRHNLRSAGASLKDATTYVIGFLIARSLVVVCAKVYLTKEAAL
jgi:hypothetical protein